MLKFQNLKKKIYLEIEFWKEIRFKIIQADNHALQLTLSTSYTKEIL